ncbi:MAG TPA: 3'-5' exonuclease, partial [Pirellulaceae bacterium]
MSDQDVKYLVFDIECVADGSLVSKVRFPGEGLSAEQAIARYRAELLEDQGNDFIPYTYQFPVSIVVAKVAEDGALIDLIALDEPDFRPHAMVAKFWKGWELYRQPTLVTFNGRSFDMPLLELAAYRYGISLPKWFSTTAKTWDQPRNRYNTNSHLDLQELLTNMGASRFHGGLNLAASLIGKPGKMEITGYMVQDMYDAGRLQEITDYCRCDVLDTYFVFLRTQV